MNPSLRNLFMNMLTRDRVVPTISASVSWLIFAMTGSGLPSLPKFAIRRSSLARRFSLELKSWSTKSSSTREFRDNRYAMNISENFGSSWSTRTMAALSSRMMTHSVIATTVAKRSGCPFRQPSPKKSPFPWSATTAFLPLLGDDADLDLAFLDVKDGIRRVSLREDLLLLPVVRHGPAAVHGGEKHLDVEGLTSSCFCHDNNSHSVAFTVFLGGFRPAVGKSALHNLAAPAVSSADLDGTLRTARLFTIIQCSILYSLGENPCAKTAYY